MADGESSIEEHLTVERTVDTLTDRVTCTEVWEGTYAKCKAIQKGHLPGRTDSCQDIEDVWPDAAGPQPTVFCASASTRRKPGGLGICRIVYQALFNAVTTGLEISEVSKPIKSWKADDASDAPDLGKIQQWEEQKDENYAAYAAYKYDGTNVMTGNTLKLAQMIFKGIESYSEYVPVITMTTTYYSGAFPADAKSVGEELGKEVSPVVPSGCTIVGGGNPSAVLPTQLKPKWVGTGDRATTNNDGTMHRVQQWSGFDHVEEDLYPDATTGGGLE